MYIFTSAAPSGVTQIRRFWGLLLTTKIGSSEHIHEQIDEMAPSSCFICCCRWLWQIFLLSSLKWPSPKFLPLDYGLTHLSGKKIHITVGESSNIIHVQRKQKRAQDRTLRNTGMLIFNWRNRLANHCPLAPVLKKVPEPLQGTSTNPRWFQLIKQSWQVNSVKSLLYIKEDDTDKLWLIHSIRPLLYQSGKLELSAVALVKARLFRAENWLQKHAEPTMNDFLQNLAHDTK